MSHPVSDEINRSGSHASGTADCQVCAAIAAMVRGGGLRIGSARLPWAGRLPPIHDRREVRSRQTILRPGETLEGVPVICDGWAARVARLSDGRRQILSFLLPGDLVSASAVFASSVNFYVESITAVTHANFIREEFQAKLLGEPKNIKALMGICVAEQEEADRLVADLGRRRAEERLARLFLHLMERLKMRDMVQDHAFALPLRQSHMADATGLTPVHVNRVLGTLRDDGIIELSGGTLRIANLLKLQRLADVN